MVLYGFLVIFLRFTGHNDIKQKTIFDETKSKYIKSFLYTTRKTNKKHIF